MKHLSLLRNDQIVDQIPTELTDEQAIDIDELLRRNKVYGEDVEVAITQDEMCGRGDCMYCNNTRTPFRDQNGVIHYHGTPPKGPVTEVRTVVSHSTADLNKNYRR